MVVLSVRQQDPSQQTGFHQGYTFADRNNPNNAMKAIRKDDVTMGGVLSKAGYTTGYWGKWGYGGSKDMKNPTLDNIQTLPTSHGYQHVVAELHHVRAILSFSLHFGRHLLEKELSEA